MEFTYVSYNPTYTADGQSLMHRRISIRGESSMSTKLLAKGVLGRGPRQPAKEKDSPLGVDTSVGPAMFSDE